MAAPATYELCQTVGCVIDWYYQQGANNTFTLLGALATFTAAYLALRFSLAESIRRRDDEMQAALITAARVEHQLLVTINQLKDVILPSMFTRIDKVFEPEKLHVQLLPRFEEVDLKNATLLTPLGDQCALRIARGYSLLFVARKEVEASLATAAIDDLRHATTWNEESQQYFWDLLKRACDELEIAYSTTNCAVTARLKFPV